MPSCLLATIERVVINALELVANVMATAIVGERAQ
jgi:hypothetical protein